MAGHKFMLNITTTELLISQYEMNVMLHSTWHRKYKNRKLRYGIYLNIAETINTLRSRVLDVEKKLIGFRSQYLAEKLKISPTVTIDLDATEEQSPSTSRPTSVDQQLRRRKPKLNSLDSFFA